MFYDPRIMNKQQQTFEKKNFGSPNISFPEYLLNNGYNGLSAYASMALYTRAMPLFNAVDKRATYFSGIPLRVREKKSEKFVPEFEGLGLFEKPNSDCTQIEFFIQVASYLDITGNCFIMATGRVNRPPLELLTISPTHVTFGFGSKFGFLNVPDKITITQPSVGTVDFFGEEFPTGIRYISLDKSKELWHIRNFNPFRNTANFWGLSRAQPVWLELQNYVSGNNTNWSMLKRGTRLSMAWVNNTGVALSQEQWDRMQEEKQKYEGDRNAGGTPLLDGMDVKPIQQSNRDMEFKELQDNMVFRVSTVYGVPLAFLTPKAMTMSNLSNSELQLYDNAVIPLAKFLYAEFTRFLMPRYTQEGKLVFGYNLHDIPALQERAIQNAEKQRKLGVNTIDEIRSLVGDDPTSGGDVIYQPANLVPIGSEIEEPNGQQQEDDTEDNGDENQKGRLIKNLKMLKNENGFRRYSDEDIADMVGKRYAT